MINDSWHVSTLLIAGLALEATWVNKDDWDFCQNRVSLLISGNKLEFWGQKSNCRELQAAFNSALMFCLSRCLKRWRWWLTSGPWKLSYFIILDFGLPSGTSMWILDAKSFFFSVRNTLNWGHILCLLLLCFYTRLLIQINAQLPQWKINSLQVRSFFLHVISYLA